MKFNNVREWLEYRGFTFIGNNKGVKGDVTVLFKDKTILSITAGDIVILTIKDLAAFVFHYR